MRWAFWKIVNLGALDGNCITRRFPFLISEASKDTYLRLVIFRVQSSEFREECPLCLEVDNQWEFSDAWLRLFVPLHRFSSNVAREDFVKEPCGCAFNPLIKPIRFDPTVGQSLEASWHQPSNPIQVSNPY